MLKTLRKLVLKHSYAVRNIYISDTGKDEHDGLTSKTPIRSWARYLKIKSGNDSLVLMGSPETILQRLHAEIEKRNQHQFDTG